MSEPTPALERRRRRTVAWVVALSTAALVFDGYDLVVYGTVVPTLLGDPSHLGAMTPTQAGTLGSYALIGVLVGALAAGAVGDRIGRRKVMLVNLAWFSVGMALTATTHSVQTFGFFRFLTGVGVGALVATVGALVAEFAPPGQRNRYNAIVYSGIPAGGVLAALVALGFGDTIGWRGLFWVGALPIVVLLPLAWFLLPESPKWLVARGRHRRRRAHQRPDRTPGAGSRAARARQGGLPGARHPRLRLPDVPARDDELRRPAAHLRPQHLAAADHGGAGLRQVLVAGLPADPQPRRHHRRPGGVVLRRPPRRQARRRVDLRARRDHPGPAAARPALGGAVRGRRAGRRRHDRHPGADLRDGLQLLPDHGTGGRASPGAPASVGSAGSSARSSAACSSAPGSAGPPPSSSSRPSPSWERS